MNLTGSKEDENQKKKFQMRQKNRDLDACFKYKQLQVDDSKNFLMKSKLCFGCHDVISKEHSGRNCQKKKKVQHLQEQPPTELHSLQPKKWSHGKEDDIYTPPMPPGNEEKNGSCVCVHARARVCNIPPP